MEKIFNADQNTNSIGKTGYLGCFLGLLGILSALVVAVMSFFFLINLIFPFPASPSKNEIINTTIKNKSLFADALEYTKKLDNYVGTIIKHTKYNKAHKNPDINGLYTERFINGPIYTNTT